MSNEQADAVTGLPPIPPPPKPVIVMIHLPPLPGSPRALESMGEIVDRACVDARIAEDAGVDAVLVENYGDAPFFKDAAPPITVAALSVVLAQVRNCVSLPVGVNVLRNDALAALSVAAATGASFVRVNIHCGARVTDQGVIEGRAAETLRLRRQLAAPVALLADVAVKHSQPLGPETLAQSARDVAYRGLADALLVTGPATGASAALDDLALVKNAVPDRPLYVASGVTPDNVGRLLQVADGVIVGTSVKRNGRTDNPLDPHRVQTLVAAARRPGNEGG